MRKGAFIIVAVFALGTGIFVSTHKPREEPAKTAPSFASTLPSSSLMGHWETYSDAIESRDWAGLYRNTVRDEYADRGVTEAQFVSLMKACSAHLPKDALDKVTFKIIPSQIPDQVTWLVVIGNLNKQVTTTAYRRPDGWHVSVSALPMTLCFANRDHKTGARAFSEALGKAGLDRYRIHDTHISVSQHALLRTARGEIDLLDVFKQAP